MDDNIQARYFVTYLILYILNIFNSYSSEQLFKLQTTKRKKKDYVYQPTITVVRFTFKSIRIYCPG